MRCDTCGNEYDKAFTISGPQGDFVFDSFECAIQKLAPSCAHCGCRVIGHGSERDGRIFCCEHCSRELGTTQALSATHPSPTKREARVKRTGHRSH